MTPRSPYTRLRPKSWPAKTKELLAGHPLDAKQAVQAILKAWADILGSGFGKKPFRIGVDLFPKPQILAFFLHELVPLELGVRYPKLWRGDKKADEKDLVYIPDPSMSVEIKGSSDPRKIFGNRSYAQKATKKKQTKPRQKKSKSGYYLAINFEKLTPERPAPRILLVRFGWLDHSDWTGQNAPTGQQASLSTDAYQGKLVVWYEAQVVK